MADTNPKSPISESHHQSDEPASHPTGTLVLMTLFILLIIVLWGYMYVLLLGRG